MATYLLFGKYSSEALKGISAKRSEDAKAAVQEAWRRVEGSLCDARWCRSRDDRRSAGQCARVRRFGRAREIDRHRLHNRAGSHDRRVRQACWVTAAVVAVRHSLQAFDDPDVPDGAVAERT